MKHIPQSLERADRIIGKITEYISFAGLGAAAVILVATTGNIILRAFFNRSLNGAIEISTDMMVLVAFCALPVVTFYNGHIKVDLVTAKLPAGVQRVLKCFNLLLVCLVCLVSVKYIYGQAFYQKQLGTSGSSLYIPYYPFYFLIAAMMLICALCVLYNLIRVIAVGDELYGKAGPDPVSPRAEVKGEDK
jgi:TRAP-type C4-dicarboxylate transport system permease small subunit